MQTRVGRDALTLLLVHDAEALAVTDAAGPARRHLVARAHPGGDPFKGG
jgi:hypothetical protein